MADLHALIKLLQDASSPNIQQRDPAEHQLKQYETDNFSHYLQSLTAILCDTQQPNEIRQLAGLLLKNTLAAKTESQLQILAQRWCTLNDSIRIPIKNNIIQLLSDSNKNIRNTSALILSKIGSIEIPKQMWSELIPLIVNNITSNTAHELKQSSFELLGYICEEIPDSLQQSSNLILNAIATGMASTESDNDIKYAATTALCNSLDFVKNNFSNQNERDLILQMIFGAISSNSVNVRVAAYQCLVQIASNYYEYLNSYISQIYAVTSNAISNEDESVALQAIEFWSTLAEEEIALHDELIDGITQTDRQSQNYIQQLCKSNQLLPLLLQCLTQQESDELDDDGWDKPRAAGTCLGLCAQAGEDSVVPITLTFVQQHIQSPDWHYKEAATLAFGAILDGPSQQQLIPLVKQALPMLLTLLNDTNPLVKDTSAWTIGRVCGIVPETIDHTVLPHLIQAFLHGLQDVPKVAAHICWAIHNLANAIDTGDLQQDTSALSPYFTQLITALLTASNRSDVTESNLLTSTYEAINVLISTAANDTYILIGQLIPELLQRLNHIVQSSNLSGEARERQAEIEALLCGSLQVITQKLDGDVVIPHADQMMTLYLRVLDSRNSSNVMEEVLMAIGSIANRTGASFEKYIQHLKPYLLMGLSNTQEYKVCTVAVGLVGDISRALEQKFILLGDDVMKILLEHLQNTQLDRSVKPHIISTIGDIALAVGGYFDRYLSYVMRMLGGASQTTIDESDYDNIEYLQLLRESILEAYTGIIHGLSQDNKQSLFIINGGEMIISFIDRLGVDTDSAHMDDPLLRASVGLIGDLAHRLGQPFAVHLRNRPSVQKLISLAAQNDRDESTRETSRYAQQQLIQATQT